MYFFCQGSHTEAAYSTKGRTYVLYADSFSLGLLVWMLRLMNFNVRVIGFHCDLVDVLSPRQVT